MLANISVEKAFEQQSRSNNTSYEITKEVCLEEEYRKVSNIRRTKSLNLNASRLILQLSLPNPLKPGVQFRIKM